MSTRRKFFILAPVLLAVVITAILALGYRRYRQDLQADTAIEQFGKITVTPENGAIAEPRTVAVQFKGPWHRWPVEATVSPVKGLILDGTPSIRRIKTGYGCAVWEVRAVFKPFRTGELKGATMQVIFNRKNDAHKITSLDLPLPPITVTAFDPADPKLVSAGHLNLPVSWLKRYLPLLLGLVLVLVVAAGIRWWMRRRQARKNAPLPSWRAALLELSLLRDMLRRHDADTPSCFVRLTDIVRNYLEKRFQLKAPQQTTEEFMHELNRSGSPLQEHQRRFLGEFMTASDLVKFAGVPGDEGLLDQAIGKAETLVNETRPQTEEDPK